MGRTFVFAILALGLASGCATKGFVRKEVDSARTAQAQDNQRLEQQITEVRNSSNEALARAEIASESAGEAREIALGKIGYREVGQYTATFALNSAELTEETRNVLEQAAREISDRPEVIVDVYGFADRSGPAQWNLTLGQHRAEAAMRYLVDLSPGQLARFAAVSYGEEKPIGEQDTREGRSQNRRVVVSLVERRPLSESPATPSETEKVPPRVSQLGSGN
jgi:outer membrane protein OmpA-like peptidoglycan-associated protein